MSSVSQTCHCNTNSSTTVLSLKPAKSDNRAITNKRARPTSQGDSCFSFPGNSKNAEDQKNVLKRPMCAIVGHPAPHFESKAVHKCEFVDLALSDYLGKYVVLLFYALDFTMFCPSEIISFSDRIDDFKMMNTDVVCISVDSKFTHLAWINTPRSEGGVGKIKVPLLSDISHSISRDYGVYVPELGHSLRGLFVIDEKGILRQIIMNDLPITRNVDETLRSIKLLQFHDKHSHM